MRELAISMTGEESGRVESPDLVLLLRRAKDGDTAAFEQVLLMHDRRVFRTALRLLGSVADAEDASQEVFLKLQKHLRRFDDTRAFGPWLYRVTVNTCRDLAARRRPGLPLDSIDAAFPASQPREMDIEEQRETVRMALQRLPEKERAAVVLRDIEGLSTAEVARALGTTEATVRSQISSARLKIKRFAESFRGRVK